MPQARILGTKCILHKQRRFFHLGLSHCVSFTTCRIRIYIDSQNNQLFQNSFQINKNLFIIESVIGLLSTSLLLVFCTPYSIQLLSSFNLKTDFFEFCPSSDCLLFQWDSFNMFIFKQPKYVHLFSNSFLLKPFNSIKFTFRIACCSKCCCCFNLHLFLFLFSSLFYAWINIPFLRIFPILSIDLSKCSDNNRPTIIFFTNGCLTATKTILIVQFTT